MADIRALMTSINEHYLTPPAIVAKVNAVLRPPGSDRKLIDPYTNGASIVGADYTCDGSEGRDGHIARWDVADVFYANPPYGPAMADCSARLAYWGRERGMPGISLTASRSDPRWDQRVLRDSADAWCEVEGRLTFWTPIAIRREDAIEPVPVEQDDDDAEGTEKKDKAVYLQRWYPWATEANLPKPFRLLSPGFAVGPQLGSKGRPSPAPFPSLVCFWADPRSYEASPEDEIEALRELVRTAILDVSETKIRARERGEQARLDAAVQWLMKSEEILGKRYYDDDDLRLAAFERLAAGRKRAPKQHPIDVRTFAQHFIGLGRITIARGRHAGVYRSR